MAHWARNKFDAPIFEPKVFGCKCFVLKEVPILGHCWDFRCPRSASAPEELFPPLYAPDVNVCFENSETSTK